MRTPRGEAELFGHFQHFQNHTVAIVPNTTDTLVNLGFYPFYMKINVVYSGILKRS